MNGEQMPSPQERLDRLLKGRKLIEEGERLVREALQSSEGPDDDS